MATASYTVPSAEAGTGGVAGGGLANSSQATQDIADLYGLDLYYDVRAGREVDLHTTQTGDLMVVSGLEALRQSLIRRMITNPGEWPTLPGYGAGLRDLIKARRTETILKGATARVRAQALLDNRVRAVAEVNIENIHQGVRLLLAVQTRVGPNRDIPLEITEDII